MSEVYKVGDITVLPSRSESFGYSALESLTLGIYTILNDIPTFNEIIENNRFNYIYQNNVNQLKNKLSEVINNDIYKDRILPNKEWQERYSLEKFEKSYIDLII